MNNVALLQTLNKWWTSVALLLLYISFNGYSRTQGWEFILPGFKFEDFTRAAASMIAPIIMLPLSCILFSITKFYFTVGAPRKRIVCAFPVAFNSNIDFQYAISSRYQALFILIFIVFPVVASIHFLRLFWIKCLDLDYCMTWKGFSVLFSNDFSFYGVTFFPFLEPPVITAICFWIVLLHMRMFVLAYKSVNKSRKTDAPDGPPLR